jgi:hypothetical protein
MIKINPSPIESNTFEKNKKNRIYTAIQTLVSIKVLREYQQSNPEAI